MVLSAAALKLIYKVLEANMLSELLGRLLLKIYRVIAEWTVRCCSECTLAWCTKTTGELFLHQQEKRICTQFMQQQRQRNLGQF